ncbi:hypothetical protein [Bordetella sp. 02P26C-1]|uniref:hypothetical protein n=1 Tax=Bordetella sp. 02P26C-1 TaxID=2683195 RepID=UPI001F330890|nr:hypothetical protein [Bordetella sp. 02P26C-1]
MMTRASARVAVWLSALLTSGAAAQTPLPPPYDYEAPGSVPHPSLPKAQLLTLENRGHAYRMPVYANHDLGRDLRDIRRILLVLPETRGSAGRHYRDVAALLAMKPARKAETLIVALQFPSPVDAAYAGLPAWRKSSWVTGGRSVRAAGRPSPLSAFEVLDDVVTGLADNKSLPALTDIVLAAHGSGAQLLQRYAVLNGIDGSVRRKGVNLRYVVANAPSYLYLTNERPRRDGKGYAPYERGICPSYNEFPYGPQQLPPYAQHSVASDLYVRYAARDVVILLGSADNNPEDRQLDQHCAAEAQGATRLARGLGYARYDRVLAQRTNHAAPRTPPAYQVIGVGHEAAAMFASECGAEELLGHGAQASSHAAVCEPVTAAR